MIENLIIAGKDDTPCVNLEIDKKKFEISGKSIPENANLFYNNIIIWFKNYFEKEQGEIILEIKLEYYNSASGKKIIELFVLFDDFFKKGGKIKILWYFKKTDIIMERKGKELLNIFSIPFEVIEMK